MIPSDIYFSISPLCKPTSVRQRYTSRYPHSLITTVCRLLINDAITFRKRWACRPHPHAAALLTGIYVRQWLAVLLFCIVKEKMRFCSSGKSSPSTGWCDCESSSTPLGAWIRYHPDAVHVHPSGSNFTDNIFCFSYSHSVVTHRIPLILWRWFHHHCLCMHARV